MKIAVCQVPYIREDISSAVLWLKRSSNEAAAADTGLVCLPECFLQGYLTNERIILIPLKEASTMEQPDHVPPNLYARVTGVMYLFYFLTASLEVFLIKRHLLAYGYMVNIISIVCYLVVTLRFYYLFKTVHKYLSLIAVSSGRAYEKIACKKLLKEKDDKYKTFASEVMIMAQSKDADTDKFNLCIREKDELILQIEQRNLYLEHICKNNSFGAGISLLSIRKIRLTLL